jgi:hypothetical protein
MWRAGDGDGVDEGALGAPAAEAATAREVPGPPLAERRREFKFNGGRGAVLCAKCRTIVVEGLGPGDKSEDARTVHRDPVLSKSGRVFCSHYHLWAYTSERSAKRWSKKLTEALRERGLAAYTSYDHHGASDHDDSEFWHVSPSGWQVCAIAVYAQGTHDTAFLQPEVLRRVVKEVAALPPSPDRKAVWAAFDQAEAAWRRAAVRKLRSSVSHLRGELMGALKAVPSQHRYAQVPVSRCVVEQTLDVLLVLVRL